MSRCLVVVLLLVACKDEPVRDGVSRVSNVYRTKGGGGTYLDLRYTVRLADEPIVKSRGVEVKAACQVGKVRLVDVSPPAGKLARGVAVELDTTPFVLRDLPRKPSLCDLEFVEASFDERRTLGHACLDDGIRYEPCPANVVTAAAGPTGVSVLLTSVKGEAASKLGFPAHLTVSYTYTAHRDMPRGAYLVRTTSCDGSSDDTWHSDLEHLRAGESISAAQNTYRLGRPRPGTPCKTTFGYATEVNGPVTEIEAACHQDDRIVRCPTSS